MYSEGFPKLPNRACSWFDQVVLHLCAFLSFAVHKCERCGYIFKNKENLVIHLKKQHEEREFECQGKELSSSPHGFYQEMALAKCLMLHKVWLFQWYIPDCHRGFTNHLTLDRHAHRVHNRKRQFRDEPKICHMCGKSFNKPNSYYDHIKSVHEGITYVFSANY